MASVSGVAWAAPPEGRGRPCPKGAIKCGDTCCTSSEDRCCRGVCTNVVFDDLIAVAVATNAPRKKAVAGKDAFP